MTLSLSLVLVLLICWSLVSSSPTPPSPSDIAQEEQTMGLNGLFTGSAVACKGYNLSSVSVTSTGGLTAQLHLITPCSAFGGDISSLTISVEYETPTRLHVHIFDTLETQYQLTDDILPRPKRTLSATDSEAHSHLSFEYESYPFAFWILRKSDGVVIFDSRPKNIPTYKDPIDIKGIRTSNSAVSSNVLVFEDQYLQLSSALPVNANIYGLGEVIATSGYRRNPSSTLQTFWARDIPDPVDENMYGTHPIYLETRWNDTQGKSTSHGVFLRNSNGMDVILRDGLIQYRIIGGTLDFYFFSGPSPLDVAAQYAETVGFPQPMPFWSFGFHLCRWGYTSINETRDQVIAMRKAEIPLETMWNDIDWMRHYRQFQFDQNYAPKDFRAFVDELHRDQQQYVMIIDAGTNILNNASDKYDVYERGHELGVWMRNPDETDYIGSVWPGYTVFPDWFHPDMASVWTEAFINFSKIVEFDGIWLDMNEPASFVDGSILNSTVPLNTTDLHLASLVSWEADHPSFPLSLDRSDEPDLDDLDTVSPDHLFSMPQQVIFGLGERRHEAGLSAEAQFPRIPYPDSPPYKINNGGGRLSHKTVSPLALHYGGLQEYSVHNVWGTMEGIATHNTLLTLKPGKRPFIVQRSTFSGIGRKAAHWLGDNFSTFEYMKHSIQGVLQFNLFAVPMVGPDVCGFSGDTDEELCNRWMQLGAFFPFYRNHNNKFTVSQEPYRWDSVRNASIVAMKARYALLPYWLSLFAEASQYGKAPVRALFYEFDNPSLFSVDSQFLIVKGIFPSTNGTFWRDWFTHDTLNISSDDTATIPAPLGTIGVHIRSGSILLLHDLPGYTLSETRDGPYALLVSLDAGGEATGVSLIDDGISLPVVSQTRLEFSATSNCAVSTPTHSEPMDIFPIPQKLATVTVLGVVSPLSEVTIDGRKVVNVTYKIDTSELVIYDLSIDLNEQWELCW